MLVVNRVLALSVLLVGFLVSGWAAAEQEVPYAKYEDLMSEDAYEPGHLIRVKGIVQRRVGKQLIIAVVESQLDSTQLFAKMMAEMQGQRYRQYSPKYVTVMMPDTDYSWREHKPVEVVGTLARYSASYGPVLQWPTVTKADIKL